MIDINTDQLAAEIGLLPALVIVASWFVIGVMWRKIIKQHREMIDQAEARIEDQKQHTQHVLEAVNTLRVAQEWVRDMVRGNA